MKITIDWLSDWVAINKDANTIADILTMAGLEVDSVEPVSQPVKNLVVGHVVSVEPHPNADKLKVCKIDIGKNKPVQIVCGAKNVAEGLKVPAALVNCTLPNGMKIKQAELRGVKSSGMLCSGSELGFEEESEGLLILDSKFKAGADVSSLLKLDDIGIDIDLTPNRGDCLSIRGVARELAALTGKKLKAQKWLKVKTQSKKSVSVKLSAKKDCPRYIGRVIEGINANAVTPIWMTERLRRCGVRAIHPVVDVTNYVMLELGQPMHGFDLNKLKAPISVRTSKQGEKIELLDGQTVKIEEKSLLIADKNGPIALAGIMGGQTTAVDDQTTDVLLESAFFNPDAIAGKARSLGLHTDSSHRFERGVDPNLQLEAIEYASSLLIDIAGGKAGKLIKVEAKENLPRLNQISIGKQKVNDLLGINLPAAKIESYLSRLGMKIAKRSEGEWRMRPPSYRFDINQEVDLVEEVARMFGYDKLPVARMHGSAEMKSVPDGIIKDSRLKHALADRGYLEVITYSFIDPVIQNLLVPDATGPKLSNPISEEMSVMRSSLWPGLISTAIYNLNRQQSTVRIFETGACFSSNKKKKISETQILAGLAVGQVLPEQWSESSKEVDFYDLKGDLESLLALSGLKGEITYKPTTNPGLHSGQGADIFNGDLCIGSIGRIHPRIQSEIGLEAPVYLFELQLSALKAQKVPEFAPLSRFPAIRRDVSLDLDEKIASQRVLDCIKSSAGDLLVDLELFDEYRGEGIDSGRKSLALGLILQDSSRTLKEEVVETLIGKVMDALRKELGAELRT